MPPVGLHSTPGTGHLVSRSFVPLEIVPREGPDFHAQLRIARVGPVQVSVVTTPPHTARTRRPVGSDASDHVKVCS